MTATFNPTSALRLAKELLEDADVTSDESSFVWTSGKAAAAGEQLRAACEEIDRLRFYETTSAAGEDIAAERDVLVGRIRTIADEACGLGPVESADASLTRIERQLFEQRARLARVEPVYEAAVKWRDNWPKSSTEWALREAVDAAREREGGK